MTETLTASPLFLAIAAWALIATLGWVATALLSRRRLENVRLEAEAAAQGEIARLRGEAARAEGQREAREAALAALERRVEELQRGLSAAEAETARLAALQSAAEARVAEAREVLAERDRLRDALARVAGEREGLVARLEAAEREAAERGRLLAEAGERMRVEFQNLAQAILDEKGRTFGEAQKTQLDAQLAPLKAELERFRRTLDERREQDLRERGGLLQELQNLRDLNRRLGDEASQLTRALKGEVRVQGAWGELILERLLEASGLRKGEDFELQVSVRGEDGGRLRPDAIVRLPDDRHILIDAKVSLVAWERYVAAADDEAREQALRALRQSIRQHVAGLAERRYADLPGIHSLDFVLMFVPIEAAYVAATRGDPTLYTEALERRVVICTASSLLAATYTVASLWRIERRNRNADDIADRAGKLYDKFVGFVEDLRKVGVQLDAARRTYDEAFGKLSEGRGSLVRQVEMLRELGAKSGKSLDRGLVDRARQLEEDDGESLGA
jgi:DNA recombination protein RmuC